MYQSIGNSSLQSGVIDPRKLILLNSLDAVKAHVDVAFKTDNGALVMIGWIFDPRGLLRGLSVLSQEQGGVLKKAGYRYRLLEEGIDRVRSLKTMRPDVTSAMQAVGQVADDGHGFVLVIPDFPADGRLALALADGRFALLPFGLLNEAGEIKQALKSCWEHSGPVLLAALKDSLPDDHFLRNLVPDLDEEPDSLLSQPFAACDQALVLDKRVLILNGWIAKTAGELARVELLAGRTVLDIGPRITRYPRPDLLASYPWSAGEAIGFLAVIDESLALGPELRLKITCQDGRTQLLKLEVDSLTWPAFGKFIRGQTTLTEPLLKALAPSLEADSRQRHAERLAELRYANFLARHPHLPGYVENPETVIAAVDRAFPLGEAGILIFGWWLTPRRRPAAVTMRGAAGEAIEITSRMSALIRQDVAQSFRPRFAGVNDWCGFVCLAPLPTRPGEERALCFDYGELGEVWLKVPTDQPKSGGNELIKEILGMIPAPNRMMHGLYDLFSNGLGLAIEAVSGSRPPFTEPVEERRFGRARDGNAISIVVPLYGRFDFLRHQLAQFADDPDFGSVDLIYVIDDPSIVASTLELAARYFPLFEVPFRVAWYGQNRGFAGANNIGASLARGEYLVLMNSDVIPRQPGWLSVLRAALDSLPDAGAVGPLLLFSDDSIQHAGMQPKSDSLLPGFLFNAHPGKGQTWAGPEAPSEHPLLTAACLMLKKQDYLDLGGLDEGYIIGDFEDSDLCLALRRQGKRLWLVPEARLWHLERQSQNLESIAGYRQLLTLYNGWRYHEKIKNGLIAAPTLV